MPDVIPVSPASGHEKENATALWITHSGILQAYRLYIILTQVSANEQICEACGEQAGAQKVMTYYHIGNCAWLCRYLVSQTEYHSVTGGGSVRIIYGSTRCGAVLSDMSDKIQLTLFLPWLWLKMFWAKGAAIREKTRLWLFVTTNASRATANDRIHSDSSMLDFFHLNPL